MALIELERGEVVKGIVSAADLHGVLEVLPGAFTIVKVQKDPPSVVYPMLVSGLRSITFWKYSAARSHSWRPKKNMPIS